MLEMRPVCEHCAKSLPNESDEAMICTFECTFCKDCVDNILENVCPNCSGGFEKRPTRPKTYLQKYPTKKEELVKPIKWAEYNDLLKKYKEIPPRER
ncbi:MAG: hypothetical protein ACI94Y_001584 [Maribacter sp.]|jgi:hypothetical protein